MPPSAPNAEPPPSERGSSSISPAAATRLRARRPQRARDPGDPSAARGSEPGGAGPGLRSIPSARPSRAGRAAPSPLLARAVQRPRLPARRPRHSRPCTPAGSEVRALRRLLPAPRGREAPAPRTSPAACGRRRTPPPYSLPGRSGGRREGLRRSQPSASSGQALAAEAAAAHAQALEPPPGRTFSATGLRRFPARHAQRARPRSEGARARGLRAGDGHAPPA